MDEKAFEALEGFMDKVCIWENAGMLKLEEIQILLETFREILKNWPGITSGSFALFGQKRGEFGGELAQKVLQFDLRDGKTDIDEETSEDAVDMAIDGLLMYPKKDYNRDGNPSPDNFGQLPSGIYHVGTPKTYVAIANTTCGRFLVSAATGCDNLDVLMIKAAIMVIGRLTDYDRIMSKSAEQIGIYDSEEHLVQAVHAFLDLIMANYVPAHFRVFFE